MTMHCLSLYIYICIIFMIPLSDFLKFTNYLPFLVVMDKIQPYVTHATTYYIFCLQKLAVIFSLFTATSHPQTKSGTGYILSILLNESNILNKFL